MDGYGKLGKKHVDRNGNYRLNEKHLFGIRLILPVDRMKSTYSVITVKGGGALEVRNGANGFEFSENGLTWQPAVSALISEGKLVVTANKDFEYIRYAYKSDYEKDPSLNPVSETSVSKFVSVFNEYGLPLGQFSFKVK